MSEGYSNSEYYIALVNPKKRKTWNALKLLLNIAEAKYLEFHNEDIETVELYSVSKDEYDDYYFNPN